MPVLSEYQNFFLPISIFKVLQSIFFEIGDGGNLGTAVRDCSEDYHLNEILNLKSLRGNQTESHPISAELLASAIFLAFRCFFFTVLLCTTSQYRVCIGKLISLISLSLSLSAPYQFHPNNLQTSFGFIYSHCCYFEALSIAAWHSTLDAFLGFFLSIKCFQKQNFRKWFHPSWLRSEGPSKEIFQGKYYWLKILCTEFWAANLNLALIFHIPSNAKIWAK